MSLNGIVCECITSCDCLEQKLYKQQDAIKIMKSALEGLSEFEQLFVSESHFPAHPGHYSRTESKTNIAKEALQKAEEILLVTITESQWDEIRQKFHREISNKGKNEN